MPTHKNIIKDGIPNLSDILLKRMLVISKTAKNNSKFSKKTPQNYIKSYFQKLQIFLDLKAFQAIHHNYLLYHLEA